jgi:hypothetical protein
VSDIPQGPGWWQASDAKWYPPEQFSGPPPAQPFPQQPAQSYGHGLGQPTGPKNEPLAVASLIAGIVGIPLLCCWILGFPISIAALVTGFLARRRISESNGALTGDGMALAGLILGAVGVVLSIVLIVLWVVLGAVDFATYN